MYILHSKVSAQLDRHFRGEEEEEEQEKKGQHQLKQRRTLSHTQANKRNWNLTKKKYTIGTSKKKQKKNRKIEQKEKTRTKRNCSSTHQPKN